MNGMESKYRNKTYPTVVFVIGQGEARANGGLESITQIIEHCDQLDKIVVTNTETVLNDRWIRAGALIHVWPAPSKLLWRFSSQKGVRMVFIVLAVIIRNIWFLYRIRRYKVQIVHCNDIRSLWCSIFAALILRLIVVHHIRDVKEGDDPYGFHWRWAEKWVHGTLVLSQEMAISIQSRLRISNRKNPGIVFIYSMIDPCKMTPKTPGMKNDMREKLGISKDEFAVAYVGAFNDKKNQLNFIREVGVRIESETANVKIYFLGDVNPDTNLYGKQCLELADRIHSGNAFKFIGFMHRIENWYHAVDLVVLASRREGFARCIIESLACGTPVISFDVCSAREILESHECGLVVPQGDYQGLIEAMNSLMENPSHIGEMGRKGAVAAQALFSPSKLRGEYNKFYKRLMFYSPDYP